MGAVNSPNAQNREAMLRAANLGGKAINISKTTACHSISYPLTSHFGVSHGHACTLTLGEMFVNNSGITDPECLDKRGAAYVTRIMKELCVLFAVERADEVQQRIDSLMDEIGLDRSLADLNIITSEDHDIIVANGFNPERVKNNPRELTEEALRSILRRIS